jgi:hypothetical protein
MRNWQFVFLCGMILLHLYWTSPDKPLPALVFAGACLMASPFIRAGEEK